MLVQEKHRKTLYRFLLAKIKDGIRTTRIKTLNTTTITKNIWQAK